LGSIKYGLRKEKGCMGLKTGLWGIWGERVCVRFCVRTIYGTILGIGVLGVRYALTFGQKNELNWFESSNRWRSGGFGFG